jgi:SAM-dependent methyltransferase
VNLAQRLSASPLSQFFADPARSSKKLLELSQELHVSLFEQAAAWFRELRQSARTERILDVGSGPGIVTAVLANAFPTAEVVAVDTTPALLEAALARAERLGIADRMRVVQATLPDDAAKLPEADLIWSSDALHHLGNQQAAIDTLHGRLRQEGLIAVCEGGLPARFLPRDIGFGRSGLQSRVDAAMSDTFAAMRAALPNATPAVDDWPGMLRASGLKAVASRTFLVDIPAPLPANGRAFLKTNLTRLRDGLAERLDATDLETIARILDDNDPGGLARRDDVFYLVARTVHTGSA